MIEYLNVNADVGVTMQILPDECGGLLHRLSH